MIWTEKNAKKTLQSLLTSKLGNDILTLPSLLSIKEVFRNESRRNTGKSAE